MTVVINGTTGYSGPVGVLGDLTTTGNTILGDQSTDTLNVANGNLVLNSSGNAGLGVTPSAWGILRGIDIVGGASFASAYNTAYMAGNAYFNGTNWIYKAPTNASLQETGAGFAWKVAPSGTAGNAITFTQAMTLDASGRLGIGQTSPAYLLDVNGTMRLGSAGSIQPLLSRSSSEGGLLVNTTAGGGAAFIVQNNGTEQARIDSSGNFGIGITTPSQKLTVAGNALFEAGFTYWTATGSTPGSTAPAIWSPATGAMGFWGNGAERMRINSAGQITMPYQPVFQAYGGTSASVISGASWVFPNTYVNVGGHYSTSTGRFTAPIAGTYCFWWSNIGNNATDTYRYRIYKNGAGWNDTQLRLDTSAGKYGDNGAQKIAMTLAAGDYIQIVYVSDSGVASYGAGATDGYPMFGGQLIG